MDLTWTILLAGWALDALIGDPAWLPWPHPVVIIGRAINRIVEWVCGVFGNNKRGEFLAGAALWCAVVPTSTAFVYAIWRLAGAVHPLVADALSLYLVYACLATRELDREPRAVLAALRNRGVEAARARLARIVGRQTDGLDEKRILRATIETVAENVSDGVVAPLFWLVAGSALGLGPALGVGYKAVNTLDSMVGYKNERYLHLGRVSALMDDIANWLPARIAGLLASACAQPLFTTGAQAFRVMRRDGGLHASPNAGRPEAAFAGALGVELGGPNVYGDLVRNAPLVGVPATKLETSSLDDALKLMWAVSLSAAVGAAVALAML